MASKNSSQIQLYVFTGFDMDSFISLYLRELAPKKELVNVNIFTGEGVYEDVKEKAGVKDAEKIKAKCLYLQDTIIRKANAKKDNNSFSLSSKVLKNVIGSEYKSMLNVLIQMGYIEMGDGQQGAGEHWYYQIGEYSRLYSMKDVEVHPYYTENFTIKKYKEKSLEQITKYQTEVVAPSVDRYYGEDFRKQYIVSLNYFHIEREEDLQKYLRKHWYNKETSKYYVYYKDIISKLQAKDKKIYSIDGNGRIYHVLSNLSTDLKEYINIDFSLDCKNSHPILFNYFIYYHHNISIYSSNTISSFLHNNIDNSNISFTFSSYDSSSTSNKHHNVSEYLRNELINNNIEINEVAKLADDELEYIYLTSSGRIWDDINAQYPEFTRKEIKAKFFKQVLYSSTISTKKKPFAKVFAAMFPNVYRLICEWKKASTDASKKAYLDEHHLYVEKEYASLSIALMNLEAQIFTTILKRMYAKRWCAVNIHDCIVVPSTTKKNKPDEDSVRSIMTDVFSKFGLCPTFD